MIIIILKRYIFKKLLVILINIKDFNVNKFSISRLTFSILFDNISNKRRSYLISSKEEIIKIISSTNETLNA